jgi:hypothetical protein
MGNATRARRIAPTLAFNASVANTSNPAGTIAVRDCPVGGKRLQMVNPARIALPDLRHKGGRQ